MKAQVNRSVAILGTGRYLPKRVITQEILNGMLTNDVAQLQPCQGVRAVKTNNKGRIEAYVRV